MRTGRSGRGAARRRGSRFARNRDSLFYPFLILYGRSEPYIGRPAPAPGRLTAEETAWFLGFLPHEIPILVAKGLLKPLGHPAHNGQKYFLTATLEELRRDEKWYSKASDAIVEYWRHKNHRKTHQPSNGRHGQPTGAFPVAVAALGR